MKNEKTVIDIQAVASLSKLSFTDGEKRLFEKDMTEIVSFAAKVSEAESTDTDVGSVLKNVFREDFVCKELSRDKLMEVAPSQEGGLFSVPRVVEGV